MALRTLANVVLAGVEKMETSLSTQPVTTSGKKKVTRMDVQRELSLTTQLIERSGKKKK